MEVRQVFVSSENRDQNKYPHGNAYTLHLTHPIKDIHKVELLYAAVPNVIYNLKDGSNVITISTDTGSNTYTFSLTPGFYNSSTLATELTQTIGKRTSVSVRYISPIGKFLFVRATGDFQITVNSPALRSMLGINVQVGISSTFTHTTTNDGPVPLYNGHERYSGYHYIQSNIIVDLAPKEGIFLDIHELRTIFNEDALAITGNTYTGHNISRTFGMIPIDVVAGGIKHFKKASDYDFYVDYVNPIRSLDRLTIEWVDRRAKRVEFNGLEDNSFMLRFHTLRKNL